MQALISWYSNLEPREQVLIKFGGPFILLLVIYLALSGDKSSSSSIELTTSSSSATLAKNSSNSTSLVKPNKTALNLATRFNQLNSATQAKLTSAKPLNKQTITALAGSAGLHNLEINHQENLVNLKGEVASPKNLQIFLNLLANQGWYWQNLSFYQTSRLATQVELSLVTL